MFRRTPGVPPFIRPGVSQFLPQEDPGWKLFSCDLHFEHHQYLKHSSENYYTLYQNTELLLDDRRVLILNEMHLSICQCKDTCNNKKCDQQIV